MPPWPILRSIKQSRPAYKRQLPWRTDVRGGNTTPRWSRSLQPVTASRAALVPVLLGEASLADKLATGEANIVGSQEKLIDFLSLMDNFEFWFNIVTP